MKKIYCLFLMMLLPLLASAETVETNGIYYNLVKKAKTAEVTENPNKYSGKVVIPKTVTYAGVKYCVTSIGDNAFSNCRGLASVTIPNSVTSIGNSAFYFCSGLTSVAIPNSVTSIGESAFYFCSGLTYVHITDLEAWCKITFYNDPSNPLYYAHHLFMNGIEIKDLVIPNSVTSIGGHVFYGCSGLTSVTIPNSVTSIGYNAFEECSGLTSMHISDLDAWCIIRFNDNPLKYAEHLFLNGKEIKDLVIPNSVTSIGNYAFRGCTGLTSVTISNSVTSIGASAFSGCSGLKSLSIPNSVTYINSDAFSYCSGLTSVTIPNSVTYIESEAFAYCSNLSTVTIGNGINTIYWCAFANCEELADIYCYAENVPETDEDAFENSYIEYATLHVPVGSLEAYKAAEPWSSFKEKVKITSKVKLNNTELSIEKGRTVTLKATVTPSTLLDKSVTWKSSNTKVATVTSSGKVKGIKAGTATITCTSNATGLSATCKVTVINGTVTLNKTEAIIEKGKTTTLKATLTPTTLEDMSVTWKSSDKSIATVTSKGKVKGVGYGTATITCTSNATGASATCKVTVGKVVMNSPEFTLRKSRTMTLIATVYPTTLTDKSVTWTSSDTKVATVTSSGKVKGIGAGTATITCTSVATGLKGTCTVTVLSTSESRSTDGNDDNVTGIKNLEEAPALAEPYDVYDLSGRKVLNQTTTLDGLPAGIYIVNGRKVLKK